MVVQKLHRREEGGRDGTCGKQKRVREGDTSGFSVSGEAANRRERESERERERE
jgi:hypothetical protein